MTDKGVVRAGIGGWTFEPWRGVFYPKGLRQADELKYAGEHLTAIEINGTYHSLQKPESFAKWAASTPDGFVFAVKASRFATNRRELALGGEAIARFMAQGLSELGDKLGPILWQFMPTKKFDPADFGGFLALLPKDLEGRPVRNVMEVRHESFAVPEFVALCRAHGVAICLTDHPTYPMIPDLTADFVYARLMRGQDDIATCYPEADIEAWAGRFGDLAAGRLPGDLRAADPATTAAARPRDVFAFFINGGKVNAPKGAMALLEKL